METATLPFLFIGYAAILYGVVELLTLMRVAYFNRKVRMMEELEAQHETVAPEQQTEIVEAEAVEVTEKP